METINGRKIEEVLEELCKPFYQSELHRNGKGETYVSARTIQKRMDRVLGKHMWSFCLNGQTTYQGSEGPCSIGIGTITIYTDGGKSISRSASGCVQIYGSGNTVGEQSVNMEGYGQAVCDEIFIKACQRLGIGQITDKQKVKAMDSTPGSEKTSVYCADLQMAETYQVDVLSEFMSMPKGGAKCQVRFQGKNLTLYFWKDVWEPLKEKYPDSFIVGNRLNRLSFVGKRSLFRGKEQMEFISLPMGS